TGHSPLPACDVGCDLHCAVGRGVDLYPLGAIVEQIKVGVLHLDQLDITVDTAVIVEITGQGVDVGIASVVGMDGKGVGPFYKGLVHRKAEGCVAAPMLTQLPTVQIDLADAGHPFKLDEMPLFQLAGIHPKTSLVDAFTGLAGIILVPDVWQDDVLPGRYGIRGSHILTAKMPAEGV